MKSNKNFHKAKKIRPIDDGNDLKAKKIPLTKKDKYFKKEIFNEIDEFEDIEDYGPDLDQDDFEEDDYIDEEEDINYDEEDDDN